VVKIEAVIDKDKLSFTCSQDVDWYTLKAAFIKVRDEIDRQLHEQEKCPYYPSIESLKGADTQER